MIHVHADQRRNINIVANTFKVMCEIKDVIQEPVNPIMWNDFKCCVTIEPYKVHDYQGGEHFAIMLDDADTNEPVAVATINIPDEDINKDEVIIKDYSENEGILSTLISAKIISVPVRFTRAGRYPICKLLLPLPKTAGEQIFDAIKDANDFIHPFDIVE